jgi:hypothetical protein
VTVHSLAEQGPLPLFAAVRAVARCIVTTGTLLRQRRVHLARAHVGDRVHFANATMATVYRETMVTGPPPAAPAALAVTFRLRGIHRAFGHALFRWESILNTPLFVGFPGFASKLWFTHDGTGAYRGIPMGRRAGSQGLRACAVARPRTSERHRLDPLPGPARHDARGADGWSGAGRLSGGDVGLVAAAASRRQREAHLRVQLHRT